MDAMDLHERLEIALVRPVGSASSDYRDALASLSAALGDEEPEAVAAWFGYGMHPEIDGETALSVHVRLLTAGGVITLDHEFSFDGAPDARRIAWSRVQEVRIIARFNNRENRVQNVWLETELGRIEFAGASSPRQFEEIANTVRQYLE